MAPIRGKRRQRHSGSGGTPPKRFYPPAGPDTKLLQIEVDLTCRSCSYNLRGLHPHGLCPECGSPISRSLEPGPPDFESGLRTPVSGVTLGLVAGAMLVLPIAAVIIGTTDDPHNPEQRQANENLLIGLCSIVLLAVLLLVVVPEIARLVRRKSARHCRRSRGS